LFIRDTLAPQLDVTVDAIEATAQCERTRAVSGMDSVAPDVGNVSLSIASSRLRTKTRFMGLPNWQELPVYLALTGAAVATTLDIKQA
jgi:hypothetical protein